MNCRGCGGANREGARFCTFCGAVLTLTCSSCGVDLLEGARFCDSCGTPVGVEPAAEPVVAARKVVTVLFADMTGSTSLEEQLDAERVRALVDRFYAALRAEVEKRGGRVVKFTGDGLMAAFGVPEVHEDDAQRAVEAATAMCSACADLATQTGFTSVSLKVGVNTGEVVVIEDDDDVVGDSVNVASRLEGAARAGEVLVGEETWRLTRSTSRYEPVDPLILKGKSEPVRAYRLLGISNGVTDTLAAPFIGRERELDVLLSAFDEAVAANAARLVTVVGSPGLGKTRLTREFAERLAGRAVVRETRCDPTSATFAPIAEALREANEIPEAADEEEVLSALLDRIPEDEPDRDRIAGLAAAILGAGQPGSTEETFWALRRMIETAAARDLPRVLVLEDLHWAEPLLLDLVEHLAEWIREGPVLLIGTARPELRDLRPSLVEGGRAHAVLALEGLDERATERLAVGLLGTEDVPTELLAKIPESTEGNPLFVREFVRMLVDDGVLQRTPTGWDLSVDVEAIEVPPTIQSLLAARVDRLRSDERTVIELAAVIGKEFYRGALDELAPSALRDQVESALESLRRKELVEPAGTYWIDEPVYRFHHVLIRDAAYRRLLKETRADVHERMADWLERKTSGVLGEHEELIGFHLEQAHEYKRQLGSPDEALGERAAALLGEAAQRALDRDDLTAAASLSGRALVRLPGGDLQRSTLLLIRCEALLSMGDVTSGAEAVTELEEIADTPRLRAWAACFGGQLASLAAPERLQEIEKRVSAAAVELAGLGDPAGAAKAHTVHGSTLARLGRFAECEAALDAALTAAREANDRRRITAVLGSAPLAALWGPNPVSRAGGRCLDLVRLSRITTRSPGVEVTSTRCQAVLEAFRGRADAARRMLRGARRTLTELGLRHELLETEQFSGIVELVADDADAALPHLREAHDGFRFIGVDVLAAQTAALLARAYLRLGELDEADAYANESEELGGQDLKASIAWRAVRAELLAQRGEFEEARLLAESAVELASRTDALIDHGDACAALAAVCAAAGDVGAARSASQRASALYERKGATALLGAPPTDALSTDATPAPAPVGPESTPLDNASTRAAEMFRDFFAARDWSALSALIADDCVFDDRRAGLRDTAVGSAAIVNLLKPAAETGTARFDQTILATRGDRLSLGRMVARGRGGPAGLETEFLSVQEVDSEGRICAIVDFDHGDLDAAVDELDERFIAEVGPGHELVLHLRTMRALNARDWDELRACSAEDLVVVDHRPASLGQRNGIDEYIESSRQLMELIPDLRFYGRVFHAVSANGVIGEVVGLGTTADGAPVEAAFVVLAISDQGEVKRVEWFPVERLEEALARFHQLVPQGGPENECIRVLRAFLQTFEARDWEALAEHHREDFAMHDRRIGLGMMYSGRDTQVEVLKGTADVGTTNAELTPIAVRGSRLSLVSTVWRGPTDTAFGSEFLAVSEIDEEGRIAEIVVFGSDLLDEALVELDERYAAGEGAGLPVVVSLAAVRALNTADWLELRRLCAADLIVVDHRPASLGELHGVDAYIEAVRGLHEVVPDLFLFVSSIHSMNPGGGLVHLRAQGTSGDGSPVEFESKLVAFLEDGRVKRFELFSPDRLDDALARWEELNGRPDQTGAPLQNPASSALHRVFELLVVQDWDGIASFIAPDCTWDDTRPGLRASTRGRDASIEQLRVIAVGTPSVEDRVVAIRGDRLALVDLTFITGTFQVDFYALCELDASGLLTYSASYGPDDLDNAMRDLDERYLAGEGAERLELVRLSGRVLKAMNERDWAGLRTVLADDLVFVDHRPTSLAESQGGDRRVAELSALLELLPSYHCRIAVIHRIEDPLVLGELAIDGRTADGSEVEISYLMLVELHSEVCTRMELFPIDRLDDALARWEELEGAPEQTDAPLQNTASRGLRLAIDRMMDQDWDGLATLYAPDVQWEDTRPGLRSSTQGREAVVEHMRVMGVGARAWKLTEIAIRGDRLALFHGTINVGTFQIELYGLCEVDPAGLNTYTASYGPDDLREALAQLDTRFAAGEGSEHADTLRAPVQFVRALNDHDLDALSVLLSPDLVFQDHRAASLGVIRSRDEWVESVGVVQELGATSNLIVRYHALERDRVLLEFLGEVLPKDRDEPFEITFHLLIHINDGLIHGLEVFPIDALPAALARFDELAMPPAADQVLTDAAVRTVAGPSNEAADVFDLVLAAFERRDWDEITELYAENFLVESKRVGLRHDAYGKEGSVEGWVAAAEVGARRASATHLAIRGDRLALSRVRFGDDDTGDEAFTTDVLFINELNDDGLIVYAALLDADDADDEDAAFAALDDRYIAGEGASYAEILELGARQRQALASSDWRTYRELIDPNVVLVDHRLTSLGEVRGFDQVFAALRAFPVVSGLRPRAVCIHGVAPDRTLIESTAQATSEDGAAVEMSHLRVQQVRDRRVVRIELFPPDGLDAAKVRFDELGRSTGSALGSLLQNLATDAGVRYRHAFESKDWTALAELISDDAVWEDRRAILGSVAHGRDNHLAAVRAVADIGVMSFRASVLATRGDRLCLFRFGIGDDDEGSFEAEVLEVNAVDADGKQMLSVVFDPTDVDAAFAELDERYFRGEGADYAAVLNVIRDITVGYNVRDWTTMRRAFADDAILVDHRPVFLGELSGVDKWIDSVRVQVDLVPDARVFLRTIPYIDDGVAAYEVHGDGTSSEGAHVEYGFTQVVSVSDGRIKRLEWFSLERLSDAIARARELSVSVKSAAREDSPFVDRPPLDNECTRVLREQAGSVARDEWDAVADLIADDAVVEDRRPGLNWRIEGRADVTEHLRIVAQGTQISDETVAVRGERLALRRQSVTSNDFEVESLFLVELNEVGLLCRGVAFAADSMTKAFVELDRRYAVGEGARYEAVLRPVKAMMDGYNSRDWAAARGSFADDAVLTDHRPVSLGVLTPDEWVASIQVQISLAPDAQVYRPVIHHIDDVAFAYEVHWSGTTMEGAQFELRFINVVSVCDGLIHRLEWFQVEDVADAVARARALSSTGI